MDPAPRRVAAHIIRKPTVEPAVCEVIENASETSRVDVRELKRMLAGTKSVPLDLETDIEVCAEQAEPAPVARASRLAHTVRRAESAPIVAPEVIAPEPAATVQMPPLVVPVAEPVAPVVVAKKPRDRWALFAMAALMIASFGLLIVAVW